MFKLLNLMKRLTYVSSGLPSLATIMVEISILKRPASEAVITQRKFFKKTAKGKVIKGVLNLLRPLHQK